jgi:hypothetical protein
LQTICLQKIPRENFHCKRLHMIKSNEMATTVGHCENCLYDIKEAIETNGSEDQRHYLEKALMYLEWLYSDLQEEE